MAVGVTDVAGAAGDARRMLMHVDNGGVDHLDSAMVGSGKCIYDTAPYAGLPPANEAVVASGVRTKRFR
jgi:hypothetical protein